METGNIVSQVTNLEHAKVGANKIGAKKVIQLDENGDQSGISFDERIDISGSTIYVGEASPGTATSSSLWRIKKYNLSVISGKFADGVTTFTKKWDDRATYTY